MTGTEEIGRGHASFYRAWEVQVHAEPGSVAVPTESSSPERLQAAKKKRHLTPPRTHGSGETKQHRSSLYTVNNVTWQT